MTQRALPLFLAGLTILAPASHAVDGVILINQAKALSGGATPGDAPGFPITITQPGSYRLSTDLVVPNSDTSAIALQASPVTIDLNGFSIRGPNTCSNNGTCTQPGTGFGIKTDGGNTNGSIIYGGTIDGMGREGVGLVGFGNTVRNLIVRNCQFGIIATGLILDNVIERNGNSGISTFAGVVRNNFVSDNGGVGILAFEGTVIDNVSRNNGSFGLQSFNTPSNNNNPIPNAGYKGNFFAGNNGGGQQVKDGTQIGQNMCGPALCP